MTREQQQKPGMVVRISMHILEYIGAHTSYSGHKEQGMGKYSDEIRIFRIYMVPICKTQDEEHILTLRLLKEKRRPIPLTVKPQFRHNASMSGKFPQVHHFGLKSWTFSGYILMDNTNPCSARHHKIHFC